MINTILGMSSVFYPLAYLNSIPTERNSTYTVNNIEDSSHLCGLLIKHFLARYIQYKFNQLFREVFLNTIMQCTYIGESGS